MSNMCLASEKFDIIVDFKELLRGFSNLICVKKYPKDIKLHAVQGISNLSIRKNNRQILGALLKLPGVKFIDGYSELLMEVNVVF